VTGNGSPEFDQHARQYEAQLRESMPAAFAEDRYFAEYKVMHMARRLGAAVPARLLDFGCGIGRSLELLRARFPRTELWGYDVSGESIRVAKERLPEARLTSDLDTLPSGFDVVFAANVFHHIPAAERRAALERCAALLADSGRIFIFEHNPVNPVTRWVFERCPFDDNAVMLPRRETLDLAASAGLRVAASEYTLFFPRPLAWLRFAEPMLSWLPLGAQYCVEMHKA